ncbi:unnamed protein product [Ectocarpus sp. 12 AP-2014]
MASASEIELSQAHEQLRRKTVKHRVGKLEGVDEDEGVDIGGVKDVAIDFLAGVVSGISGIVVGQPFDTIKVRLQTQDLPTIAPNQPQPQAKGAMACAAETVSKEGVLALFKGMSTPLASAALVNAICFGAYAQSQRTLAAYGFIDDSNGTAGSNDQRGSGGGITAQRGGIDQQQRQQQQVEERRRNAGLVWSFVGGSFAGLCQAVVIIPTDTIKIKLQIQVGAPGSSNLKYRGPVDCAMNIVKTQGVRGLFRGTPATAIRDTPSMGLYFASYEAVKERLESRWGFGEQASSFWAGGLAGALSWFVIYPFDVVKSVQQATADPMDPNTRSMTACFRHVYKTAGGGVPGVRRFFRGVSTTVVRAVPVNAAIFPTFEWTVKVLNKAFPPSS